MQTSIFDQAEKAKNDGIELVYRNADSVWKKRAADKLMELIRTRSKFTSDDMLIPLEKEGIVTKDNRAIAAILRSAARMNLIRSTETYIPCKRKSRHRAPVLVWKSLVY